MTNADDVRDEMVAEIDAERLGAYGIHVLVGEDEAGHRWRSDDRENLYSVSKGVSALAAGIAIDEGLLTLETPVLDHISVPAPGAGVEKVTLGHLLSMSSGIDFTWFGSQPVASPDLAVQMLSLPTRGAGAVFQYSDASTYTAMRMLGAVVGDVRDWLMPRLFEPLGIDNPQWHRCPLGWIIGGTGLELRTEELARIGRMLRDGGGGLVSRGWVDRMHSDWVPTGGAGDSANYGLAVWQGPGRTWRLDGLYGQYVIVDEQADAVVTITAHEEHRDHRLAQIAADALSRVG